MSTKLILTNASQLRGKYGNGFASIQTAVQDLIAADHARGLETQFIALDDAVAMRTLNASPITSARDPKQNKTAIDGLYKAHSPEYMMILGAQDVVPHQDLSNPAFDPDHGDDADETADGDLPYACEAPYSQDPQSFTGATRVVGRLPDLPNGSDPTYLIGLLKTAAAWTSHSLQDYSTYLGISAEVWQESTALSLSNVFGAGGPLHLSPQEGPTWTDQLLHTRSHFINCHGSPADFQFYGQSQTDDYPISHTSIDIDGRISEGTLVAAECCYGAQLFDPTTSGGKMPICSAYLKSKAYGFWGSSTIAYGPAKGNGQADLLCQYFLKRVLAGSSLGRAALEARQAFAQSGGHMDPYDLKTLAQFNLLGDPSIHPVNIPTADIPLGASVSTTVTSQPTPKGAVNRSERRRQLLSKGLWIAQNVPVVRRARARRSPKLKRVLEDLASQTNIQDPKILSFHIDYNPKGQSKVLKHMVNDKSAVSHAIHVVLGRRADVGTSADNKICRAVAVVAKEVGGEIDSYRLVFGK